jgi:hypothetical protein
MISMRRLMIVLAAGAALAVAGCGGGSETGSSADSAAMAPRGAGLYVSVDTNRDGEQWKQLDDLLAKVPGGGRLVDELVSGFAKDSGLDLEDDVLPAVGDELVLVVQAGSADPVALVQPEDADKLRELTEQAKTKTVTREIEGWTALAENEQALDAYEQALARGRLADDPAFSAAMADLPPAALVRAYARGKGLERLVSGWLAGLGGGGPAPSASSLGMLALAVAAEDDGLRISGAIEQEGLPPSHAPKLLPKVPAGAFLAGTFSGEGLQEQFQKAIAGNEEQLKMFEQLTGIELDQVLELFAGEVVFYVRPGLPIPEITLAVEGGGGRFETVDRLFRQLAAQEKAEITTAIEDGVTVSSLDADGVTVRYAETGGLVVVTTARGGIRDLVGDGPKLVDEDAFATAARDVGYDGSTSGLVYLDVDAVAPLLQGLGALAPGAGEGMKQLTEALEAFDSLALNATSEGERARFEGFLRVR